MDEAIATVVTVTGTTPELAAQYVQLADGDPNQAVQLFFENGGADLAGSSSSHPAPPPAPSSVHQTGLPDNPIEVDEEETISDDNDPEITGFRKTSRHQPPPERSEAVPDFEDDEAMARRLQNEMYGEGAMEDEIRAPIARQAETLVGPAMDPMPMTGPDLDAAVQSRMMAFERRRQQRQCELLLVTT